MKKPSFTSQNPSEQSFLEQLTTPFYSFPEIEKIISAFHQPDFLSLNQRKRFRGVNEMLYKMIKEAPPQSFLLGAVLDFCNRIKETQILKEPFHFTLFEFWLNHFSGASDVENYEIRSKIIGQHIPRGDYQAFFPVGMGRLHSGSHFVSAHLSPDIDTMIASFWGWVDAFGARLGTGLHLWSLPGGAPESPVTSIFTHMFGKGVLESLPRTVKTISLSAMDLLTQKDFFKESGSTLISEIDYGSENKVVILVNEEGHYLGDWRKTDLEMIYPILTLFKSFLYWIQKNFYTQLISLFTKKPLSNQHFKHFIDSFSKTTLKEATIAQALNEKQQALLSDFIKKILNIEEGINSTFQNFSEQLQQVGIEEMAQFQIELSKLPFSSLFTEKGELIEDRPRLFEKLQLLMEQLDHAILSTRHYVERLDIGLKIKKDLLSIPLNYITLSADIDEIRIKIHHEEFLTVVINEQGGNLFPVGIVRSSDLQQNHLGTVSFRDFSNFEEVKMASYLELISVVDHHKTSLQTLSIPTLLIGDVQSCNVLMAEQMFLINDQYSLGGMSAKQIEDQIKEISNTLITPAEIRIFQKLLQRRIASQSQGTFYINPQREANEYFSFLQAILDDTDLLTKASARDLQCVMQLLNRLKSLTLKREVEIINFDDISKDANFIKTASRRILKQKDMYTIYKQVYASKEAAINDQLERCISGYSSNIFLDSKEQNGCARIGQTKIFSKNFAYFKEHVNKIRQSWLNQSEEVFSLTPEIDLYIHMISTISSAEEVYGDNFGNFSHDDELWFWIPNEMGRTHLSYFLSGFKEKVEKISKTFSLEFIGEETEEVEKIFDQHFENIPQKRNEEFRSKTPFVILKFKAGTLNSRKAMISPYLPKLIA